MKLPRLNRSQESALLGVTVSLTRAKPRRSVLNTPPCSALDGWLSVCVATNKLAFLQAALPTKLPNRRPTPGRIPNGPLPVAFSAGSSAGD